MAKHILLDIEDKRFTYALDEENIQAEAALDGVYVIRTSLDQRAYQRRGCRA